MAVNFVFVDTNILMELFFHRPKYNVARSAVLSISENHIVCTSVLSVTTLLYYVESEKFDKIIAHNFIKGYRLLDMNRTDYKWAEDNDEGDFEDALQVACARRHNCEKLLTLDLNFNKMYGKYLPIQTI